MHISKFIRLYYIKYTVFLYIGYTSMKLFKKKNYRGSGKWARILNCIHSLIEHLLLSPPNASIVLDVMWQCEARWTLSLTPNIYQRIQKAQWAITTMCYDKKVWHHGNVEQGNSGLGGGQDCNSRIRDWLIQLSVTGRRPPQTSAWGGDESVFWYHHFIDTSSPVPHLYPLIPENSPFSEAPNMVIKQKRL